MTTRRPPAIGAGVGDGMAGAQLIAGIVVSPRHWAVSTPPFFITVSLVEATFFISVAFSALCLRHTR
jgi:F-type H+-transporting ATPase subunit c